MSRVDKKQKEYDHKTARENLLYLLFFFFFDKLLDLLNFLAVLFFFLLVNFYFIKNLGGNVFS